MHRVVRRLVLRVLRGGGLVLVDLSLIHILADTTIVNAARYRARSLPIAGMLLRPEDRAEEQMTLLE